MPIDPALLARIRANDSTLTTLDLSGQALNDATIQQLVESLATNTILTSLDVSCNRIGAAGAKALATITTLTSLNIGYNQLGPEGAKALAANTTLTSLKAGYNRLGDEGAKALAANTAFLSLNVAGNHLGAEGAKALAANTALLSLNVAGNQLGAEGAKALAAHPTLTSLDIMDNRIGDAGAKALACNTTLTSLDVWGNQIGSEGAKALAANLALTSLNIMQNPIGSAGVKALATNTTLTSLKAMYNQLGAGEREQLTQAITRNKQQLVRRRDQFLQQLIVLACDKVQGKGQSLWSQLPQEVMLHIISLMDFRSPAAIGKSARQTQACADFIFNHVLQLRAALAASIKTQQDFKVLEKITYGKSHFQFFPSPPSLQSGVSDSKQEKSPEKPAKRLRVGSR